MIELSLSPADARALLDALEPALRKNPDHRLAVIYERIRVRLAENMDKEFRELSSQVGHWQ